MEFKRHYDYYLNFNKENVIHTIEDYCNVIVETYLLENKVVDYKDFLGSNYTCLKKILIDNYLIIYYNKIDYENR